MSAAWRFGPHHAHVVFRAMLDAIARPGRIISPDDTAVLLARCPLAELWPVLCLADHGVAVALPGANDDVRRRVARATDARLVDDPSAADMVVAARRESGGGVIGDRLDASTLRRGTAEAPELGARLVVAVEQLRAWPATHLGEDAADVTHDVLAVRGPGAASGRRVEVAGLEPSLVDQLLAANDAPPAGVDTWLVDRDGRLVALPRSVTIAVGELALAGTGPAVPMGGS